MLDLAMGAIIPQRYLVPSSGAPARNKGLAHSCCSFTVSGSLLPHHGQNTNGLPSYRHGLPARIEAKTIGPLSLGIVIAQSSHEQPSGFTSDSIAIVHSWFRLLPTAGEERAIHHKAANAIRMIAVRSHEIPSFGLSSKANWRVPIYKDSPRVRPLATTFRMRLNPHTFV